MAETASTGAASVFDKRPSCVLKSTDPMVDFRIEPNELCFCNTRRVFGACCGSEAPDRAPPCGVLVVEDYIPRVIAKDFTRFAALQVASRLGVFRRASEAGTLEGAPDKRRAALKVDVGPRRALLDSLVRASFTELAARVGESLDWFELPTLIRYDADGFYAQHSDSHSFDPATGLWRKILDRDLSLIIYLNDDFDGGMLRFTRFNYCLRPRAGMAVMFPSDNRYLHTAERVSNGTRYAVASWAAVKSVPKVASTPRWALWL